MGLRMKRIRRPADDDGVCRIRGRSWPGITDATGVNRYFGWYTGVIKDFDTFYCGGEVGGDQ